MSSNFQCLIRTANYSHWISRANPSSPSTATSQWLSIACPVPPAAITSPPCAAQCHRRLALSDVVHRPAYPVPPDCAPTGCGSWLVPASMRAPLLVLVRPASTEGGRRWKEMLKPFFNQNVEIFAKNVDQPFVSSMKIISEKMLDLTFSLNKCWCN